MSVLDFILIAVEAYLLGSLNAAIVVSKLLRGYDIRDKGSGNAGLTNSLRTMGRTFLQRICSSTALRYSSLVINSPPSTIHLTRLWHRFPRPFSSLSIPFGRCP